MSNQKQELHIDGAFIKRPNASDRLLFTFQALQNRLSDSRISWSLRYHGQKKIRFQSA